MGRKPCCTKEEGLNRGAWTAMEDKILVDYIKAHGEGKWRSIPKAAGLNRCGKSCRLRWLNYLRPDIKRGNITRDEEDLIIRLHKLLGNRWSLIAGRLPGRTDNEIKNYWNTVLSKRLKEKAKESDLNTDRGIISSGVVVHAKARRCTRVFFTPQLINEEQRNHDITVCTVPNASTANLAVHVTAAESDSSDRSFVLLESKQETPSTSNVDMGFDGINIEADFASEFYKQLIDFDFCDVNTAGVHEYGASDCGEVPLLKEEMVKENWDGNDCVEANWDSDFAFLSAFLE